MIDFKFKSIPLVPEGPVFASEDSGMQCKAQNVDGSLTPSRLCNAAMHPQDRSQDSIFRYEGYIALIGMVCSLLTGLVLLINPDQAFAQSSRSATKAPQNNAALNPTTELNIRRLWNERFPDTKADSISSTPFEGLYEVQVDGEILYTDDKVSFAIDGVLIDAKNKRNITRERAEKIASFDFSSLPVDLAIKLVRGNGERKVAVFEDPNCGYCKQLRRQLLTLDNITIYTYLFPVLSADSVAKSKAIWCAPDRLKAFDDWMLSGRLPSTTSSCDTPIEKILALGQKLRIRGTPALFFSDNTRESGAPSLEQLKVRLDSLSKIKEPVNSFV